MLIKLYTLDGGLVIIEGVTDVAIPANPAFGDYANDCWKVYCFDEFDAKENNTGVRVVTFSKDGPCMLRVYNKAYICNDAGKTIEPVYARAETTLL